MYIQCTRKLLSLIDEPKEGLPADLGDESFCWHANVIELNGEQCVIMVNNVAMFLALFILEPFVDFTKQVRKAIRISLEDSGLPPGAVTKYLASSKAFRFCPTSDRSQIGRLNQVAHMAKEHLAWVETQNEGDHPLPDNVLEFPSPNKGPMQKPKERKARQVPSKPVSNETPRKMVALDVELGLVKGNGPVKRSFLVPLDITFGDLHDILQIGFGWQNLHLHEFRLKKRLVRIGMFLPDDPFMDDFSPQDLLDEKLTHLSDYIPRVGTVEYEYDFGDSWIHTIKVGQVTTAVGLVHPECTAGVGSTPPEDCGGMYGYSHLCKVLSDPSCEEYEELLSWAGDEFGLPFDKASINKSLKRLSL